MITLKKLKWGNAFSYGDNNEIDFTANTVTQILGANGNGKSSIPLILEEVLYNKNSKGIKKADIANRYSDGSYWITAYLIKDEDEYKIEVVRKSNIKIKLFKNGIDISSHTATNTFKQIEETIMGMDFKMSSQLIYQNNNSSLQFLTATDTNRKKFLIDLLHLEEYVELFELFKEAVKQHSTTVIKIQGQIENIEKWIQQNKLEDLTYKEIIAYDELDTSIEQRQVLELTQKLKDIDRDNKLINNNNHYKTLLSSINIDEIQSIEVSSPQSYDNEQSELGALTSDKKRISAYVTKIKNLGDSCPTCEQTIEPDFKAKLINDEVTKLETIDEKINTIQKIIDYIKSNNKKHQYKQEKIKEWEELFGKINRALPDKLISKEDLQDQITNLTLRISNAHKEIEKIQSTNLAAEKHNSKIDVYKEQSNKFLIDLEESKTKLQIESKKLTKLELLKKSLSTNGLIAYKIENMVKDLEELTNDYLAELSDGRFTIEFSVSSDKLNVIITDNGREVDILALSSGELARVNTSTLLALRKLMNSISKSQINVLFLDEVIGVLDDQGKERLVEVLLKEDLNTFIVSHGWKHSLLAKLEVVKEDNFSRLEHG